ncbi:hypothetical protein F0267_01280 [Vibrio coralliilyticus]|uniref:Uncharacterized protein n=3 Tax=Vibrio TaxID=662 RepID=A0AAN0SHA7_9VIBR|nr:MULTISPECIES: hypothetical protein [Vibrio]CAH1589037.1 conserved hypothetical protein [Vibrio jasicida]AIW22300.1 hypothetical protein IX92_24840 [Vibrio coralliilyticus]MCZ2798962.1 hypothetical protein [Vibrio alginolyticus]NOH36855.1 hypothetical protein [Vibrio coralliilyticus]PAW02373.1 hypothetical protein CKJ79_17065 [Vibrio coralliilyticus]
MKIENLSDDAKESLVAMIQHCTSHGIGMGMDEGFDDDDKKRPFRLELESLAKELESQIDSNKTTN